MNDLMCVTRHETFQVVLTALIIIESTNSTRVRCQSRNLNEENERLAKEMESLQRMRKKTIPSNKRNNSSDTSAANRGKHQNHQPRLHVASEDESSTYPTLRMMRMILAIVTHHMMLEAQPDDDVSHTANHTVVATRKKINQTKPKHIHSSTPHPLSPISHRGCSCPYSFSCSSSSLSLRDVSQCGPSRSDEK